ncbi:MFS transporter [Sphingosinicella sp. BN140058]|uniref:spinster family MFS transporter n=1 Tax=Sphingosinicella sp. BN140058 TaxID=1892855 RepID=UPI001010DBD6|nr:MFS transporter [Sphingosinicella sp. BN140058]QAY77448.1 MFS transporter [Sphingosinicella sp. BN140058]
MNQTGVTGTHDRRGRRVLAILLLAYIFNFIDRQIIGVLAVPIKAELALTDTQLSLMGGLAFALFYSGIAIPVAWFADRKSRVNIIAVSVALWSLFTALCGVAQNFWHLFLARMGVGIGEAGGVAPSYALISDFYPKARRARALALFSLGIPIGSALGVFFGGWIASNLDWRSAFLIVGLAGLPAALAVKLGIPEPVRGGFDTADGSASAAAPPFPRVAATLARTPSFWLLSFGAASGSILGYGLIFWLPSFFSRSFGLSLIEVSWFYGSIVLVGGVAGTWLGGWIGDRTGPSNPASYARIPAICFLIAAPAFAFGLFAPSLPIAWILFAIGQMLALAWLGPVIAAVQHIVPPNMRATASASFLFINNLIGIGFGIFFLGFMSDRMTALHGQDSLRWSILYGLVFYLLSAALYFVASKRLERDWYRG